MNKLEATLVIIAATLLLCSFIFFMPTYNGMTLDALMYFCMASIIPIFLCVVD